jgi:hypothetical protein
MLHFLPTLSWAREAPDQPQLMPTETNLDDGKSRLNVPPRMCSKHETFEVGIEPTGADGEKRTEVVGWATFYSYGRGLCVQVCVTPGTGRVVVLLSARKLVFTLNF